MSSLSQIIVQICKKKFKKYGEFSDPHKRQDMFMGGPWQLGSAIPNTEKHMYVGPAREEMVSKHNKVPWQHDKMLPRRHDIYRTARGLGKLRETCSVLINGQMQLHNLKNNLGGFFSFSRLMFGHVPKTGAPGVEAVVIVQMLRGQVEGLEKTEIDKTINPHDGKRYVNVFDTSEVAVTRLEGGKAYLVFDGPRNILHKDGGAIFMHEDLLSQFDDDFGVAPCSDGSSPA